MPPESVTFFVDRSLGKHQVARALRSAGARVVVHDDEFPQDTRDEDWIIEVAERSWAVLTSDLRIRHNPLELQAVVASGAKLFVLTSRRASGPEAAEIFTRHLVKMQRLAAQEAGPFLYLVSRTAMRRHKLRRLR